MKENDPIQERIEQIPIELDQHIEELHKKIQEYGSFNIIANSIVHNQLRPLNHYQDFEADTHPIVSEYLALICLKFPYSLGIREFTHTREVAKDLFEINKLAIQIIGKYGFVHHGKYVGKSGHTDHLNPVQSDHPKLTSFRCIKKVVFLC